MHSVDVIPPFQFVSSAKATSLNKYRFASFKKLMSRSSSVVTISSISPTSAALKEHSYGVYHQIQVGKGTEGPVSTHILKLK